jgi:hypothetical protein
MLLPAAYKNKSMSAVVVHVAVKTKFYPELKVYG